MAVTTALPAVPADRKGPPTVASPLTPSDSAAQPYVGSIYVGVGGTVVLRTVDADADVTYLNVPNGGYLYVEAQYVRATGTTATNMILER